MKVKIFTQVNRCNFFLDIWLNYYSKVVKQEDIHIYYEDMFRQNIKVYLWNRGYAKVNVTYVNTILDLKYFNQVQKELLQESDVLLYADPDEIIFSKDLKKVLNTFSDSYLTTTGFEIIHNIQTEAAFDVNKKMMEQRSFGLYMIEYNKPLILKEPLSWTLTGKHSYKIPMNLVDGLYLIHLCRFDFYTLLKLNIQNKSRYTKNQNACWHHLITDEQNLKDYYNQYYQPKLIEIPEEIKNNLDI